MKHFPKRLAASLLTLTLLCNPLAASAANPNGTTIDINTHFDMLMQYVEWYGLKGDSGTVLRDYFNQYFEQHPEQFEPIVNDIMQSIDPYSYYMTKEEYAASYGQITGFFYGIGITFSDALRITDVYSEGAAAQAGLKSGDVLLSVGGIQVTGKSSSEVIALLRSKTASPVTVVVNRNGKELSFTMTRKETTPHHVYCNMISDGVAYVRVAAMGSDPDTQDFIKIWNGFAKNGVRAAILDLRNNGGGLINMASSMIETIAPESEQPYLGLRYSDHLGGLTQFETPGGGVKLNKLVVLTNQNTASSAEIVCGSLSDLGIATLLGEPTYGKGVGQYHLTLDDAVLILTTMQIELPSRGAYNGSPIQPDIYLSLDQTQSDSISLLSLDTDSALVPGMQGDSVKAMTERLARLGYLPQMTDAFNADVLNALRRFQIDQGFTPTIFATVSTLKQLDNLAQYQAANASGLDNQLAAALSLCKKAAAQPAQYTAHADGSWTNH